MKFFHICNPENRRAEYLRSACQRLDLAPPIEIAWQELLENRTVFSPSHDDVIRLESPGENFEVEKRLVERGNGPKDLDFDHGRLRFQTEWFAGWQSLLKEISEQAGDATFFNHPADITTMFDKWTAQQILAANKVPTPDLLGKIETFDQLTNLMAEKSANRVFLKPSHSSSASGVVALQMNRAGKILATTSAEIRGGHIYNSLRIHRYQNTDEIRLLVNQLGKENLFAERWFPKHSVKGRIYDLRILVVAGNARHIVARTSRSPITNLHLGNERGVIENISFSVGREVWQQAQDTAVKAALCFPKSHYVAVDLMIGSSGKSLAVAEVNAFGDLIPNLLSRGDDTYTAELRSFDFPKLIQ